MIIKVNYTVSDIYMSTSVSPVYIKVVYSGTSSGGGGVWGTITGTLSAQTDLQSALDLKVPTSRTLTINGVAFDLSANRSWTISSGTVTSVGLSMPSAFSVANSPITSSGTLAVTANGTAAQYIRGDGQLATLPSGASGGSAVNYYLNGSVAASVGTYFQMSKIAVLGAGTDFAKAGNGLISQFLTDVADPNRLEIPAGNWNFEMYMSASSSGGTPAFYVELLKYNGTTFTSIASSSAIPEAITSGTIIDLYLTSLAIPQTTLLATDRLAIRVYIVNSTGGRTITMHTENSHLCEIITNFAGGIAALNGLTANTQYLATGTSGTDFAISSLTDTHTFNLPTASATNRGALSSADWSTFNGKASGNIYTTDGTLTGNRTITSSGNSLTILGGIVEVLTEQIALKLQTSTTSQDAIAFSLINTAIAGKHWKFRSTSSGNFDIRNITNNISPIIVSGANGDVQIYNNITNNSNYYILGIGQVSIKGLWLGKTAANVTNYSICENGAETIINADTGGLLRFRIANADKMMLTNAGRLLLGTTSEGTFLLDVNGTARVSGTLNVNNQLVPIIDVRTNSANGRAIINISDSTQTRFFLLNYIGTTNSSYDAALRGFPLMQMPNGGFLSTNNAGSANITDIAQSWFQSKSVTFNSVTEYASAQVAIDSITKGFLPPRMTNAQRTAITSPAVGLIVYCTDTVEGLYIYKSMGWTFVI